MHMSRSVGHPETASALTRRQACMGVGHTEEGGAAHRAKASVWPVVSTPAEPVLAHSVSLRKLAKCFPAFPTGAISGHVRSPGLIGSEPSVTVLPGVTTRGLRNHALSIEKLPYEFCFFVFPSVAAGEMAGPHDVLLTP